MTSLVTFDGFFRKWPIQQLQLVLVLAATLSLSGCSDVWCWPFECGSEKTSSAVADDSKADTSTDDSADTSSDTSNDTVRHSNQYHHWNTKAWHGQGSALVMCSNVTNGMKWCKINGHSLLKHGSADKGRDVWTIYQQNLGGVIQCYRGGITWEFKVSSASGVHYGNCSS